MTIRLLIDSALSFRVAQGLREAGFDAVHVRKYGLQRATDETIFHHAIDEGRCIVSADTDFGALLALWQKTVPSFILFRGFQGPPSLHTQLLINNLKNIEDYISKGAIIVIERERLRIRRLPIKYKPLEK